PRYFCGKALNPPTPKASAWQAPTCRAGAKAQEEHPTPKVSEQAQFRASIPQFDVRCSMFAYRYIGNTNTQLANIRSRIASGQTGQAWSEVRYRLAPLNSVPRTVSCM